MNPLFEYHLHQTRRQFFGDAGLRLGGLALAHARWASRPRARAAAPRPRPPAAARLAALPAEGQVAHLPAHERRPVARSTCGTTSRSSHEHFDKDLPDSVRKRPAASRR